jgi:HEAT repeat protein
MGQASDVMTWTKPDTEIEKSADTPEARSEKAREIALALEETTELALAETREPEAMSDDPDVLRDQIEQTRSEMTETLSAIQSKLAPHLLVDEAKDKVREVTREKTTQVLAFAKRNPIPVGIGGAVLGWLVVRAWSKRRNRTVVVCE